MINIKALIPIQFAILTILSFTTILVGCQQNSSMETINIIEGITVFKSESRDEPLPPGGWAIIPKGPYPTSVQGVFDLDDKMYLGLVFSNQLKNEVSFSKITFLNIDTGVEEGIKVLPHDLGPFEPGEKNLLGFSNPWEVPNKKGEYKIRLYLGDDVVASALFKVR